jgi:hypothetical protein
MKFGTWIVLPDGREATVVYNGIDGRGIVWGHAVVNESHPPRAVALLRNEPEDHDFDLPCVGTEYTVARINEGEALEAAKAAFAEALAPVAKAYQERTGDECDAAVWYKPGEWTVSAGKAGRYDRHSRSAFGHGITLAHAVKDALAKIGRFEDGPSLEAIADRAGVPVDTLRRLASAA